MPGRTHVILLLLAAAAACGGDPPSPTHAPPQIADSAGVRIVEYEGTPTVEPPFHFPAVRRYRHGANPGDYVFQRINVGRLFPDGSAAVSDDGNSELVVLSPDGTTHEVLARQGEGPGEVMYVYAMSALGQDRVLIADPSLRRVTLFAGRSVARTVDHRSLRSLSVAGIGSSGELLLATRGGPGAPVESCDQTDAVTPHRPPPTDTAPQSAHPAHHAGPGAPSPDPHQEPSSRRAW